jgi:CRP-like cAMP-binding protein
MNKQLHLATLQGIQFLRGVSHEHLEQIAAISTFRDCENREVVFDEGEPAECVYLVVFGKLSIELGGPATERKHLVDVVPGEMLGWSSLLERPKFAATARATEPTRLVQIDTAKLLAICEEDPEFGYQMMRRTMLALAKRLNMTWGELSHLHTAQFLPVHASAGETDD